LPKNGGTIDKMINKIIKAYPYPIDQIINDVIEYIVVYFDYNGKIIDYNQMFNEVFKVNDDGLETLNIKDLMSTKMKNGFNLAFDDSVKMKRLLVDLNEKYAKNSFNNSYDCYIYKTHDIYCLIGKKDLHDSDEIMNNMTLLTNRLSNLSRDLNKKNRALKEANKKIENLMRHDELTGLSNRRHFMEYIQSEIANAHRYKKPLALVMCDLDHFKAVNDTYGHGVGDLLLQAISMVLSNETRKGELAARIGGDEFAIVLTQTPLEKGKMFTERIRRSISEISLDEIISPITLSLGITELKPNESIDTFLKRADMAMYKAKKSGRNKVCTLD